MRTFVCGGGAGYGLKLLNAWLNVPADDGLMFDADIDSRWERAIGKIGVDVSLLSADHGHA